mmetsp:Transcript_34391/g.82874  ORF Transcript_34391/g.82874 Transcript_34391/m.82874 type:complete len:945 (+) Transcript_34391:665-3499(+)
MTSLLSFSLRRGNIPSSTSTNESINQHPASSTTGHLQHHQNLQQLRRRSQVYPGGRTNSLHQSFITAQQSPSAAANDPWGLGIATSTSSSCDSVVGFGSGQDHGSSTRMPPTPSTPEGLRPRKPIYRIRQEVHDLMMMRSPKRMAVDPWDEVGRGHATGMTPQSTSIRSTVSPSPPSQNQSQASTNLQWSEKIAAPEPLGVPPSFACVDGTTPSTLAMESFRANNVFNDVGRKQNNVNEDNEDDDEDIISNPSKALQEEGLDGISSSLDAGRPRTAVGAVVLALTGSSSQPNPSRNQTRSSNRNTSSHSILPARDWMDRYDIENPTRKTDEDDNESSLHASPSSNPWRRRQMKFNEDTSFTRDLNASWIREGIDRNGLPYDFDPIFVEPGTQNRLNISAISHSLHNNHELDSSLASMADTMNDEEYCQDNEKVGEIPRFYQPLVEEDGMAQNEENPDNSLILSKKQNQRRIKESLILSMLEQLQDETSLLLEVQSQGKVPIDCEFYEFIRLNHDNLRHRIEDILLGIKMVGSGTSNFPDDTTAQALQFYLALIQIFQKKTECSSDNEKIQRWKPVAGFRSNIGLEDEDPSSPPPAQRGGLDGSLSSFPMDAANDATPHTSNVSIATTITTVLSPDHSSRFRRHEKISSDYSLNGGFGGFQTRQVIKIVVRVLERLRYASFQIVESRGDKTAALQEVRSVYLDLLQLPIQELKHIVKSFELAPIHGAPNDSVSAETMQSRSLSMKQKVQMAVTFESEDNNEKNPASTTALKSNDEAQVLAESDDIEEEDNHDDVLLVSVVQDEDENCEVEMLESNQEEALGTEHERIVISEQRGNGNGYEPLIDEDQMEGVEASAIDDLRRTVGSFDQDCMAEERDQAPDREENNDQVDDHNAGLSMNFVAVQARPTGAIPSVRSPRRRIDAARRWKRRFFPRRGGRNQRRMSSE